MMRSLCVFLRVCGRVWRRPRGAGQRKRIADCGARQTAVDRNQGNGAFIVVERGRHPAAIRAAGQWPARWTPRGGALERSQALLRASTAGSAACRCVPSAAGPPTGPTGSFGTANPIGSMSQMGRLLADANDRCLDPQSFGSGAPKPRRGDRPLSLRCCRSSPWIE